MAKLDAHRINTLQQAVPVADIDIDGGKAEFASQLLPLHNAAADAVGSPEQRGCRGHIARSQGLAHAAAADAHSIGRTAGENIFLHGNTETMPGTRCAQCADIALTPMAVMKIRTHNNVLNVQVMQQKALDKLLGRHARQLLIKRQHPDDIDTCLLQPCCAHGIAANAPGGCLRAQ